MAARALFTNERIPSLFGQMLCEVEPKETTSDDECIKHGTRAARAYAILRHRL